jgi:cytochrome c oxidase cbb3-type subunit IV
MFSFIKQYAQTIIGIDIYPKISLVIFFGLFVALLFFVIRADKNYIHELERIPLDEKK